MVGGEGATSETSRIFAIANETMMLRDTRFIGAFYMCLCYVVHFVATLDDRSYILFTYTCLLLMLFPCERLAAHCFANV